MVLQHQGALREVRALVVPDKSRIDHKALGQTHDDGYYKMYFRMLEWMLNPEAKTRIYLTSADPSEFAGSEPSLNTRPPRASRLGPSSEATEGEFISGTRKLNISL